MKFLRRSKGCTRYDHIKNEDNNIKSELNIYIYSVNQKIQEYYNKFDLVATCKQNGPHKTCKANISV